MAGFANDIVYANNGDFSIAGSTKGSLANGLLTNGQLWIGTTAVNVGGTHISVGTIVSPDNSITIGYSSPNITAIVNTSLLFKWQDVAGAFISSKNNGYFITATASSTLPAGASEGDTIKYFVDTTQILTLTATGGQIIRMGNVVSSSGGTAVSTLQGDSVEFVFRSSNQCWCAIAGFTGTWVLA